MSSRRFQQSFAAAILVWTLAILPAAVIGQTRVTMPKNKYKVQDDVKVGNQAEAEVRKQFPILNDPQAEQYVTRVGERLANAIPREFQQPAFDYRFKIVNASDINAFALPGGPMFVNRGMIQAARNEGEMAGVMAHEISHVALRHATAQQTKLNNPLNQILGIGAILGGAILGGQAGAQAGQIFAAGYFLRYSREYETQADVLGAQIMAEAGYDPRDLANMFQTIARQSGGGRNPEWLSSHPDPGNRYQKINQEASLLRVSPNPIKLTREFERTQSKFRGMPPARTMAQIQQDYENGRGQGQNPTTGSTYSNRVELPSAQTRAYTSGNWIRMNVPNNWREISSGNQITFSPYGGYGDQGITHGVMIGTDSSSTGGLRQANGNYVNALLQSNSYLRQRSAPSQTYIAGRQGFSTVLAGRSNVTGRTEVVTIYTTKLNNGELFYIATVSPEDESYRYNAAFRNLIGSIRLND